ncbi:MAG: MerR family transcriptional regulator [Candidatus Dormibacteraeota bacterium]|nr:MerR family transcriptional regulator [Candidatus Dormibacteraeota bacterium]
MDMSIGELAALTGVRVKTIRYYSDLGLVPEAGRTEAGYRRYDATSLARLELVRALRDLGLDLAAAGRVAALQSSLEAVAGAQADAIDVHIRQLQLRRRVLRAIARGITRPEEVSRMTAFARASADEVNRIMEDFLAAVFAGNEANPFMATMRSGLPALADDPTEAQLDAWIELAALVSDRAFRARVREMVVEGERMRAQSGISENDGPARTAGQAVVGRAGAALASGLQPHSQAAAEVVAEVVVLFAHASSRTDDAPYRAELADQLERFSDARVERYWQLIGVINGWPAQPSMAPAYAWFIAALRAHPHAAGVASA